MVGDGMLCTIVVVVVVVVVVLFIAIDTEIIQSSYRIHFISIVSS